MKEETIKPTEEEMKEQKKKIDESLIRANIIQVESLGKVNKTYFKELQDIAEQIESKTKEILKINFDDEEIERLFEGSEIVYQFNVMDYEKKKTFIDEWKKTLKKVNNNFVADNFFLLFSNIIEQIQDLSEEDRQKSFDTMFFVDDLMKEKEDLIHDFDQLEEKIVDNNKQISELGREVIQRFARRKTELEIKGKTEEVEVIDLTDLHNESMKILESTSKAIIDEVEIYKLNDKTRLQLKVFVDTKKEKDKMILTMTIKGESNYFSNYYNISVKKEPEEEVEKLEDFRPIPIDKAIAFNDKLSNNLHNLENNTEVELLNTGGKKTKKLQKSVMKVLVKNGEMETSKILEPFDKVVLQSIYSLIQKNQFFDIQMLKEEMTGNKNRHKGNIDKEIEKSLNKLRTTLIKIEIPEELQKTMETRFERVGIEDTILPIRRLYVVKGGHEKSVFGFTSNSIYFDYAKAKGQLISKDTKLLQGGIGNATKETIILTDYISTRIKDMEHQKEKNHSKTYIEEIKFDTMFSLILTEEDLQIPYKTLYQKKSRYKTQILTIVQNYKNEKVILNYEEYSEGIKIKI